MTTPHAESPSSPRTSDRIAVQAISLDTIALLHAEADRTGRTVAAIAADWLDTYHPPTRRVVAVVDRIAGAWRTTCRGVWFESAEMALSESAQVHPNARIEDAGPGRYEFTEVE